MIRFCSHLRRGSLALARVERQICRVLILLFTVLLLVNVAMRHFLNSPLFFAEELAIYIMIWMAFISISISLHEDSQVRLTLFLDGVPRRAQQVLRRLLDLLAAAILAIILAYSIVWLRSPATDFELAVTLGIAKWPFFVIIPLFTVTGLLHLTARFFDRGDAPC